MWKLAPGVKKPNLKFGLRIKNLDLELDLANNLDLANFIQDFTLLTMLLLLLILSIVLFLLIDIRSFTKDFIPIIFSIKVSRVVI